MPRNEKYDSAKEVADAQNWLDENTAKLDGDVPVVVSREDQKEEVERNLDIGHNGNEGGVEGTGVQEL